MKFIVHTIIDITQTRARRGEDHFLVNQQQNFMTFLQTLGLRANPTVKNPPSQKEISLTGMGFGTRYKGTHLVWTFEFDIEYEDALDLTMLIEDFDLVPIILGLNETAKIEKSVFRTKDNKERNIIFNLIND